MPKRERIYIFIHWPGFLLGLTVLAIFVLGYLAGPSGGLAQTLGVSLVIAGIVVLVQSNENLRGVIVEGCHSAPVAAGGDATLTVTLRNSSDEERIGLRVRARGRGLRTPPVWVPALGPGETRVVELLLSTTRRGRLAIPSIWISSVRPTGLFFAWKIFPQKGEVVVYPAPRGIPLDIRSETDGGTHGTTKISGDDVSGHRPYIPGDTLSRLDWRIFAKTGNLLVRTLEGGGRGGVALRWDDTRPLPDVEARLGQLSFWIDQCVRESRPFVLDLGEPQTALDSGSPTRCREALADFRPPV